MCLQPVSTGYLCLQMFSEHRMKLFAIGAGVTALLGRGTKMFEQVLCGADQVSHLVRSNGSAHCRSY